MPDILESLTEKEKELNISEENLNIVEDHCGVIERKITKLRNLKDKVSIRIRKYEQEIVNLKSQARKAKHSISTKRREHAQLFRDYIKERDTMKGMR